MPYCAAIAAAVIAGGASVYSSGQAAQAGQTQAAAGQAAQGATLAQMAQGQDLLSPWSTSGKAGNNYLQYLIGTPGFSTPTGNPNAPSYSLSDFMAYNNRAAPGDSNNAADAQSQYQQYTSGMYGADAAVAKQFGFKPPTTPGPQGTVPQPGAPLPGAPTPVGTPAANAAPDGRATAATSGIMPVSAGSGPTPGPAGIMGGSPLLTTAGGVGGAPNAPGYGGGYGLGPGALTTPFNLRMFQQDPSYNWMLQQGQGALLNNASATGGTFSGNTLRALSDWTQNYASQDYQQALNNYTNWQNQVGGLFGGVSSTGVNAAGSQAGLGANATNAAGQFGTSAAAALAAGQVGSANALTQGAGNIYNQYLTGQLLSKYNPQGNPGGTPTGNPYGMPSTIDPNTTAWL
ncbi:MAG TPA: hypothetical protein VGM15_03210 [Burkholderiaceae bacterium]|jgi:hypothetical protein